MVYERKEVIIIAKTYPNLSKKYEETVCVAGIDAKNGEWIRMFPIAFRKLPLSKQFKKFDVIGINTESYNDKYRRIENQHVQDKTIEILRSITNAEWGLRRKILLPKLNKSVEELERLRDTKRETIGMIKPKKIMDFHKKPVESLRDWERELLEGTQKTLLDKKYKTPLDKIPYWMGYKFLCDDPDCNGHDMMCEDWETLQLFRAMKEKYKDNEVAFSKVREKYFDWMLKRDVYFIVGTESRWNNFLIIAVFYPPK